METKPTVGFPSYSRVIAEFVCDIGDADIFTGALNIGAMINDQLRKLGAEPLATSAKGCDRAIHLMRKGAFPEKARYVIC